MFFFSIELYIRFVSFMITAIHFWYSDKTENDSWIAQAVWTHSMYCKLSVSMQFYVYETLSSCSSLRRKIQMNEKNNSQRWLARSFFMCISTFFHEKCVVLRKHEFDFLWRTDFRKLLQWETMWMAVKDSVKSQILR